MEIHSFFEGYPKNLESIMTCHTSKTSTRVIISLDVDAQASPRTLAASLALRGHCGVDHGGQHLHLVAFRTRLRSFLFFRFLSKCWAGFSLGSAIFGINDVDLVEKINFSIFLKSFV